MKPKTIIQLAFISITLFSGCGKDVGSSNDYSPPIITSTSPLNNSIGVARNITIKVDFSLAMSPSSITSSTFILKHDTTVVPGSISYSGNTAIYTPSVNLMALTKYNITVTKAVKSNIGTALAANFESSFTTGGSSTGLSVVNLGSSINYVILAKTAINNSPKSTITGDLGLSPAATSYITGLSLTNAIGYATSSQVTGKVYAADMVSPTPINLTTAVNNMVTAYNDAAGRPFPDFVELATGNIGGKTLTPGLYKWTNTVTAPTSLTISGGPNDVFIFQIAGNLTVSSAARITLTGGAQAKNIFWQVAGNATIGTTAHFEGVILSMTGITFKTGASLNGRALAQSAVILDSNVIKP